MYIVRVCLVLISLFLLMFFCVRMPLQCFYFYGCCLVRTAVPFWVFLYCCARIGYSTAVSHFRVTVSVLYSAFRFALDVLFRLYSCRYRSYPIHWRVIAYSRPFRCGACSIIVSSVNIMFFISLRGSTDRDTGCAGRRSVQLRISLPWASQSNM